MGAYQIRSRMKKMLGASTQKESAVETQSEDLSLVTVEKQSPESDLSFLQSAEKVEESKSDFEKLVSILYPETRSFDILVSEAWKDIRTPQCESDDLWYRFASLGDTTT